MSKFAEECKKKIAEAGVKPREIKVEVNFIPLHNGRKLEEEVNYWETKCEKINRIMIKCKVENRDLEKKIADLEHENAYLKIRCAESLKKETKFESSYVKKHSELVKEAAELREEKTALLRKTELLNEHLEVIENNTSLFIDEINTLWGDIVNINLESKEGLEKFKELQIQVAKSKNLLDLALGIK